MGRNMNNAPAGQLDNIEPSFVRRTVSELTDIYKLPRPQTDEEVKERIYQFFSFCKESSMRPGLELLALFLGVTRQSIYNWEHGIKCSPARQEMILHARAVINAFLEQAHLQQKINPVSGIFLSKAWLGYSDDVMIRVDAPQRNDLPSSTLEEIVAKRRLNPVALPTMPTLTEEDNENS